MKRIFLALVILTLLYPFSTEAAEDDYLWIGNVNIRIGMEKNEAVTNLQGNYALVQEESKTGDPTQEYWSIYRKSEPRMPTDLVGRVCFQEDKVAWVSKYWGSFDGKEVASFGQALASVLSGLIEKGMPNATIHLRRIRQPGLSLELIVLVIEKYEITIVVSDRTVSIQESLPSLLSLEK